MTFSTLLDQTCDIYRKTSTKDDYSFVTNTWTIVSSDVNCRIDPMFVTSPYLSNTPNGQIAGNDYVGFFESGQDIQKGDRITWQGMYLYARPVNYLFSRGNTPHHLEVMFGLQET